MKEGLKKNLLIYVLSALLLIASAVLVWLLLTRPSKTPEVEPSPTEKVAEAFLGNEGNINNFVEEVDGFISETEKSEEKAEFYRARAYQLFKATYMYNSEQIMSDILKSDELAETFESAYDVYYLASHAGDSETSKKYFEIAKERNPDFKQSVELMEASSEN